MAQPEIQYTPRNDRQRAIREAWRETRLFFLMGEAGTGKTTAALAEALIDVVEGRSRKVFLSRPMVSVDEEYGFLTGDLQEKTMPWMGAFRDVLGDISHAKLGSMDKLVEIIPVGMMRGRTIKHGTLIVDEAQNCTWNQLLMIGTRIGEGGRIVLSGDTAQYDLNHKGGVPLEKMADRTVRKNLKKSQVIRFLPEDQLRDPLVREFLMAMED